MSFKEFKKELNGNRVEGELIKTIFYSLLTSFIVLALAYFFKFRYIDNFASKYGYYLVFSALSIALIMPAIRQIRAYKKMGCMAGMMVGMTIGMISGFLLGFYTGAVNGMFYGGFYGTLVGIVFGIWNGKCCGIMGMMEGIMAGLMGGLMGAMSAVMMINDNIKLAGVFVFIISAAIVSGLNYMIYKEMKETETQKKEDQMVTLILTFILIAATTLLIVFGPKSPLF